MPRIRRSRRRATGLLALGLVVAALFAPFLGGAGAQTLLTAPSVLPGDLGLVPAAGFQEQVRLARGSDTTLAVWTDMRTMLNAGALNTQTALGAGSMKDVYAARIAADGRVIDQAPIIVDQSGFNQTDAAVGWNGQNWLVVWMAEKPGEFAVQKELRAARLSPAGVLLDQRPIILDPAGQAEAPYTVIEDGAGNWVVTWTGFLPPEDGSIPRAVHAVRVSGDGTVPSPARVVYNHHSQYMDAARIERAGDRYLVTFHDVVNFGVWGLTLDANFSRLRNGPELLSQFASGYALTSDGNNWFVTAPGTHNGVSGVYGVIVSHDGDPVGSPRLVSNNVGFNGIRVGAAWDGQYYFVAFTNDTGLHVSRMTAEGQSLDPSGRLVKSDPSIGSLFAPSVAPVSAGGVQTAWQSYAVSDLRTARVARDGAASAEGALAVSAPRQYVPRMASSGAGFLAVFRSEVSNTPRIMAQHLDAEGQPVDQEPFVVTDDPAAGNASVGWDGSNYLVVWDASTAEGRKTYARAVPAAGAPFAPAFFVMNGETPDAAGLNGQFLVVNIIQKTSQIRRTQAVRVSSAGAVSGTPVEIEGVFNFVPRVAAFNGRWFAVWEYHGNHDDSPGTIRGAFVEPTGAVGTPFVVGNAANDGSPHLAVADAQQALVVWTTGDVRSRRINADGTSPDPDSGQVVVSAPGTQARPAVSWDGAQYAVTWLDTRNEIFPRAQPKGDIYGARLARSGVPLEEFAVSNTELPEETPFVVSGPAPAQGQTGLTIFSYARFYPEAPYSTHRVTLRGSRLEVPNVGTPPAAPSGLVVTQTNQGVGNVTLRWADNSSDEYGFKIEQNSSGTWTQVATAQANTTTASGFTVGATTATSFRVRAYNAAGESGYTNAASAPVVTLTPFNPNVLNAPASVKIQATATDAEGVARVEFYGSNDAVGGYELLFTDTAAPYEHDWTNLPAGYYYVRAIAYDTQGSTTETLYQGFVVRGAPTGTITSPAAGATFAAGSNITIDATAEVSNPNNEYVTRVDFYADTTLVGSVQGHYSTYTVTWANAPAGVYQLTARPTVNTGLTGTSSPVQITVGNPGPGITGRVTDGAGNGLYNVTVSLTGTQTAEARTDAAGSFSVQNLSAGGSYTVTPSAAGYTFSPSSRTFASLTAAQSAAFTATPGPAVTTDPNAQPIYAQPSDGHAIEVSTKSLNTPADRETADDFDLAGTVRRVVVNGYRDFNTPSNPVVRGAFLRFYADNAGAPGQLQAEYFWPAGAAGFVYDAARPTTLDLTLPQPFNATGRHFISAQLVIEGSQWAVVSSNRASVRGASWTSRDRLSGGQWGPNPTIYTPADMAFSLYGSLASTPRVDTFTPATAERSGIVRITGAYFGATKGQLKIDGKDSPFISFWSDTLIVAHVPEAATVGTVPVVVTAAGGTSGSSQLNVTTRQSDGRIKWRAEAAGDFALLRPTVAPPGVEGAGTVYLATNGGYLYAWAPDGALKWVAQGADGEGAVSVGSDGTIYTGTTVTANGQTGPGVAAWRPDGSLKWKFGDPTGQSLRAGPNVGPDGKIYFVFRPIISSGDGVNFGAVRPDGTLAFNVQRNYFSYGSIGKELAFGRTLPHVYFHFSNGIMPDQTFTNGGFFAYDFSGQLVWAKNNLGPGVPAIAPDEDLRLSDLRVNARNGQVVYNFNFPPYDSTPQGMAEAGPDNTHYIGGRGELWAVNPDGSQKWRYNPLLPDGSSLSFNGPVVNAQNSLLFIAGGGAFLQPNMFIGVDPETGEELWRQHVAQDPDPRFAPYGNVFFGGRAVFTPDGDTAYIQGDANGDQNYPHQEKYLYLYALDTSAGAPAPNQPPVLEMMGPINGSRFPRNITVGLAARATDDAKVTAVDFYVTAPDGVERLFATVTKPTDPALAGIDGMYETHYDATAPGGYRVRAVARDAQGLSAEGTVIFTIVNEPPQIQWMSPVNGSRYDPGQPFTLIAHPSDSDGQVTKVEFYSSQHGLVGTDTTADENGNYSVPFAGAAQGDHTLTAWAYDDNDARRAAEITISVAPAPTPTPTPGPGPGPGPQPTPTPDPNAPDVAITSPANNSTYAPGTNVTFTAAATAKNGRTISGVRFVHKPWGTVLCTDLNAPYTCSVTRNETYLYDVVAVAFDNTGLSTTSAPVRIVFEREPRLSISGRIRHSQSTPGNEIFLPNALVRLSLNFQPYREVRTDSQGNFSFTNLGYGGEFTLTPAEPGYTFYPPSVAWSGLVKDETYDFAAEGPLPPGPTPTPGPSALAWDKSTPGAGPRMAVDAAGNTYVTGVFVGPQNNADIKTLKYGPDGALLWSKTFNGAGGGEDRPADIEVDSSGNVFVAGHSYRGAAYSQDFLLVKYDAAGTEQWVRYVNSPKGDVDIAHAVDLDSAGNAYVTGYFTSAEAATGRFFYEFATAKFDTAGNQLWLRQLSTGKYPEGHIAIDVAVDAAGNSYVTGYAWLGGDGGDTSREIITVKYGPDGAQLWAARYNGHATNQVSDQPVAIRLGPNGAVYVAGVSVPGAAREDYLLIRYDSSTGAQQWARNWSGPVADYLRDMAVDASGNVYLTGETYDVDFQTVNDYPTSDVATVKFSPAGAQLWERFYRAFPGKNDAGRRVSLDSSGNAYVGAYSENILNSDSSVIKYLPDGTEAWVYTYDNSNHTSDNLSALEADAAGNVYLAGTGTTSNTNGSAIITTAKLAPSGAALNIPPDVSITPTGPTIAGSPDVADGKGGGPAGPTIAGRSVRLTALAADRDGTVVSVSFYLAVHDASTNTTSLRLLGTDTAAPYEHSWENVDPGTYVVTATATDNSGATRTAHTETVTVTAAAATYAISGQVTSSGSPLAGVTVTLSGSDSSVTATGADGRYSFTGLAAGGTYVVTPTMSGQTFTPGQRTCASVTTDQTGMDFAAATASTSTEETAWFDDSLPAGAAGAGNGETWNWTTASPAPHSGAKAHQSAAAAGLHNHYFLGASQTLSVAGGEKLFAYVYVDPASVPSELMIQWYDGAKWYNAYWGSDRITSVGTRVRVGDVPAAGKWVRLEVAASALGAEGKTLSGMAFNLYDGKATWDKAGKLAASSTTPPPPTTTNDVVWVEDSLPAGAAGAGNGESWNWVSSSPSPYSGSSAHQSAAASGLHNHYFLGASETLPVGVGDTLYTYVYVDPANVPTELMIQWYDGLKWYNAYWGADQITSVGTRTRVGDMPAAGKWVRLEVAASAIGAEGKRLSGMAFDAWGGRVTWDRSGKTTSSTPPPPPTAAEQVWVEDSTPAGAIEAGNNESWEWVSASPSPYSGAKAHRTGAVAGFHNHYFHSATETMTPAAGETLYTYVYVDPANVPSELMLQWYDGASWKTAYWGADRIDWIGARLRVGDVPAAGGWVRLEVPAAALGLEGKTISGMAFNLWDGRATWDRAGKLPASTVTTTSDTVWVEDAVPAGAIDAGNNETWSWVTSGPAPHSGAKAHQSAAAAGFHNHYFHSAAATLSVGAGDVLYTYVYLDPQNAPTELMLQWYDGTAWRNAYWGADQINWVGERVRVGDLPAAGSWARLEVPAAQLGLEGKTLSGMSFNLWGGRATFDKSGKGPRAQ